MVRMKQFTSGLVLAGAVFIGGSALAVEGAGNRYLSGGASDVLKLVQAQVSEPVILAFVQNSSVAYNLTADEVVQLRSGGVPDPVMAAMLTQRRVVSEPAVVPQDTQPTPNPAPQPAPQPAPALPSAPPPPVYTQPMVQYVVPAPVFVPQPVFVNTFPVVFSGPSFGFFYSTGWRSPGRGCFGPVRPGFGFRGRPGPGISVGIGVGGGRHR